VRAYDWNGASAGGSGVITVIPGAGPHGESVLQVLDITAPPTGIGQSAGGSLLPPIHDFKIGFYAKATVGAFGQIQVIMTGDGGGAQQRSCVEGGLILTANWQWFERTFTGHATGHTMLYCWFAPTDYITPPGTAQFCGAVVSEILT
jgi:hypothetical protein